MSLFSSSAQFVCFRQLQQQDVIDPSTGVYRRELEIYLGIYKHNVQF